jgi:hypothetical protein
VARRRFKPNDVVYWVDKFNKTVGVAIVREDTLKWSFVQLEAWRFEPGFYGGDGRWWIVRGPKETPGIDRSFVRRHSDPDPVWASWVAWQLANDC